MAHLIKLTINDPDKQNPITLFNLDKVVTVDPPAHGKTGSMLILTNGRNIAVLQTIEQIYELQAK